MSDFTVQIEGPGLTLRREVEEPLVLRILGLVLGPRAQALGNQALNGQTPVTPLPLGADFGESPREHLDRSSAKTNPEKITSLGLYLRAQGREAFTTRDIRELFVSAGEATPRNLPRDFKDTIRAGWLAPRHDQPDRYYVTNRGETAATGGFTERPPVPRRRSNGSNRANRVESDNASSARRTERNGRGARSVLDELIAEGYFMEPRTCHDIIQAASERGHLLERTDLTQPLLTLVQSRPPTLRRQKVKAPDTGRDVWSYSQQRQQNSRDGEEK